MFLDQRGLRALADWMIEAIRKPIIERLDSLMGLVSIDDTVLQGIAATLSGVDTNLVTITTQVQTLITAGTLSPDDAAVQSIQGSLSDIGTQLGTLNTALTPAAPAGPTSPTDPTGSTGATGPAAPVDPTDPSSGTTAAPTS